MAVRAFTVTEVPVNAGDATFVVAWAGLLNGDTGSPFDLTTFVPVSVQLEGTFGAGGSSAIEGSNDATNYRALAAVPNGAAIAITVAGIKSVADATRLIRPNITAGDGTTSLTASLLIRKAKAR